MSNMSYCCFENTLRDLEDCRDALSEMATPILMVPQCQHGYRATIGVYGGHIRNRKRTIGVYGAGCRDSRRKHDRGVPDFSIAEGKEAMGIDWMTIAELSQAIPPAFSEFIARHAIEHIRERIAA